jgi:hypothetical protein
MTVLKCFTVLILIAGAGSVQAEQVLQTRPKGLPRLQIPSLKKAPESRFSSSVDLSTSSNLYKPGSAGNSSATSLDMIPAFKLSEAFTLSARTILTATKEQDEAVSMSNTTLKLTLVGPLLSPTISSKFSTTGTLPTNRETREGDSYRGAIGLGSAVTWKPSLFSLTYALSGTRNIHEYNISAAGVPNVQYSVLHVLTAGLELGKWNLSAEGLYRHGWTYRNFERQAYASSFGASYKIASNWAVGAGLDKDFGPAFKPNGRDSNIEAFDQNESQIRANVTFTN